MNWRELRRHFTGPIRTTITPNESAALGRVAKATLVDGVPMKHALNPVAGDLAIVAELHRRVPPAPPPKRKRRKRAA